MNIITSVHKQWVQKILNNEKLFEFRNIVPKQLKPGSKIYLYETGKNGGRKIVAGECVVDEIWPLLHDGKYAAFGAYDFIDWYFENVEKNKEYAEMFREAKTNPDYTMPDYKLGTIINYALCKEEMEYIKENHCPIDTFKISGGYDNKNSYLCRILDGCDKSNEAIKKCDSWLESMGFYIDGESTWKNAIKIKNIKKYKEPIPLSEFKDIYGRKIEKAPQSFMYTLN